MPITINSNFTSNIIYPYIAAQIFLIRSTAFKQSVGYRAFNWFTITIEIASFIDNNMPATYSIEYILIFIINCFDSDGSSTIIGNNIQLKRFRNLYSWIKFICCTSDTEILFLNGCPSTKFDIHCIVIICNCNENRPEMGIFFARSRI